MSHRSQAGVLMMTYITGISFITNITTSSNYSLPPISISQPCELWERREMKHYQQTLIIPMPSQRFREPTAPRRNPYRGVERRYNVNRELNSILAFFD